MKFVLFSMIGLWFAILMYIGVEYGAEQLRDLADRYETEHKERY